MIRLIAAIVAFCIALAVLKLAIVAVLIGGFIFRPKATVGLLLLLGAWALFKANPAIGLTALGIIIVVAIIRWAKTQSAAPAALPDPETPAD